MQFNSDWAQFQAFVADVEKMDAEDEDQVREAENSLENMTYVNRYREALERVGSVGATDAVKRKRATENLLAGTDPSAHSLVRNARVEVAKKRRLAADADSEDDYDPTNWRCKRL
ncbi:hypothetical protein PINS_up010039 [Pythium insidiosum]|nr:hypothetical protein PINS_up010039 [Pythium insidiosum]